MSGILDDWLREGVEVWFKGFTWTVSYLSEPQFRGNRIIGLNGLDPLKFMVMESEVSQVKDWLLDNDQIKH